MVGYWVRSDWRNRYQYFFELSTPRLLQELISTNPNRLYRTFYGDDQSEVDATRRGGCSPPQPIVDHVTRSKGGSVIGVDDKQNWTNNTKRQTDDKQ